MTFTYLFILFVGKGSIGIYYLWVARSFIKVNKSIIFISSWELHNETPSICEKKTQILATIWFLRLKYLWQIAEETLVILLLAIKQRGMILNAKHEWKLAPKS